VAGMGGLRADVGRGMVPDRPGRRGGEFASHRRACPASALPVSSGSPDRDAALLRAANRVAVLTGAGVSAESGIPTFRDADGLWEGHPVEQVATPAAFRRDPRLVWQFYNARRANLARVQPNPGHIALARLEEHFGADHFTVVTQ